MKFGDVVGMDYEPEMRLMVLRLVRRESGRETWSALVLQDNEAGWFVGTVVTVGAHVAGLTIIEEAHERSGR